MQLSYETYLDKILGGWIGKSIGGTIGARFEGSKHWIEVSANEMFPAEIPPNDDLDLQVLWLKVLEEKGAHLTSDDMAQAWLEGCWYPFNEYGIFRRNWQLGIHPPYSGQFGNAFWETGMGCPIRSEIWGYVFPGAPDLAAKYAEMDGLLDHTEQSVGGEKMLSAMASMAFWIDDVRRLTEMFWHYLPAGTPIEKLTRAAFECYDSGLTLREARDRLMALAGHPEACDSQINVPFTFLGLLYGDNDLEKTMLETLKLGYDTDCTLATAGAFLGQILGASKICPKLKEKIGDTLVMGIEYNRPEMTLSALARDTARMGVLLTSDANITTAISDAPKMEPLPKTAVAPKTTLTARYEGQPTAEPGKVSVVTLEIGGESKSGKLKVTAPENWDVTPREASVPAGTREIQLALRPSENADILSQKNIFKATLEGTDAEVSFGLSGTSLWRMLGIYWDTVPREELDDGCGRRSWQNHFVYMDKEYIDEKNYDAVELCRKWTKILDKPAIVSAPEKRIDLSDLVGIRGQYCAYLSRTVISPEEREALFVVGNNDAYRIYLNGEMVAERNEMTWWTPNNCVHTIKLKKGENKIMVKLLKQGEKLDFSFAIRHKAETSEADWCTDLADANPYIGL